MGKKILCSSAPRVRKSKDQGWKEIKGRAIIYITGFRIAAPAQSSATELMCIQPS